MRQQRLAKRWFTGLSILAMLGMLLAVPLASNTTVAMVEITGVTETGGDMPCHKPAKPCPDCPQKSCPGTAACAAKCAHTVTSPVADQDVQGAGTDLPRSLAAQQAVTASITPPLLRPPIV